MPMRSGKKHKKCHGSVAKRGARDRAFALAAARRVVASTYQPLAAHGYALWQVDEMLQFAQKMRSAKV